MRPGDTLTGLALRHGTTVSAIVRANCLSSETIYANQRLYLPQIVLPPTASPTTTTTALPPTATPAGCIPQPSAGWALYTVQPGDSLYALALSRGTTVALVVQLDDISDIAHIAQPAEHVYSFILRSVDFDPLKGPIGYMVDMGTPDGACVAVRLFHQRMVPYIVEVDALRLLRLAPVPVVAGKHTEVVCSSHEAHRACSGIHRACSRMLPDSPVQASDIGPKSYSIVNLDVTRSDQGNGLQTLRSHDGA